MSGAGLIPGRALPAATRLFFKTPANPWSYTALGRTIPAGMELFERSTRRYGKPEWNITSTVVSAEQVPVRISVLWERPFCRLLHFLRRFDLPPPRPRHRSPMLPP